jgi:hypothetical protein
MKCNVAIRPHLTSSPAIRAHSRRGASAQSERGYALLMVIFMAAVMIIGAATVSLNWITQGRRQREDEMIWRGEQYERGVRLYYHKLGRFPQTMDDLTKNANGIRFMRQAYKNPTSSDGKWRLIYVTPAGQLVNSVRYTSLAQMNAVQQFGDTAAKALGVTPLNPLTGQPGNPTGDGTDDSNSGGQQQGQQTGSGQTANPNQPSPPAGQGGQPPQNASGQSDQGIGQQNPLGGGQQPGFSIGGEVIGGSIIGVGGSADKRSVKIYKKGKTYHQWEFIWNPLAEATIQGQTGTTPGKPITPSGQTQNPQQPQNPK